MTDPHLIGLNAAQLEATRYGNGCLQILAGPGSGKTKTLTSRVAHLILQGIPSSKIIVTTFTNKAAGEMKHRLRNVVGHKVASQLIMGTFHSMCVRWWPDLRRYGRLIGLREGWSIADEGDNQTLLKKLIADKREAFAQAHCEPPKPAQIRDIICKAKAKDISPSEHAEACDGDFARLCNQIYDEYQTALERDNALDFDDLLIQGHKLLRDHPRVVADIQHVFIDEFQDTNDVQYKITQRLAAASHALTIVGDPDQSIYGWRSAEVGNLDRMKKDFPQTQQIFLEQNYRSTGAILKAALAVVRQDTERVQKSLFTTHPVGLPVVLRACGSAPQEADFISSEIKRLIAQTGGMLDYNDFAILLRFNALSRLVEASLQKAGMPCRLVGGHRFFERVEVGTAAEFFNVFECICSRLSTGDQCAKAWYRRASFPRLESLQTEAAQNKTVDGIIDVAAQRKLSPFEVVAKAVKGQNIAGLKPAQRKALRPFVECIAQLKVKADEGCTVPDLIEYTVTAVEYDGHLQRSYPSDYSARLENVKELASFAKQVADELPVGPDGVLVDTEDLEDGLNDSQSDTRDQNEKQAFEDEQPDTPGSDIDESFEELMQQYANSSSPQKASHEPATLSRNPLRHFLEASMLSTDAETEDAKDDKDKPKITISTCHAAKGLEWPVVFVPAVEDGTFPFYRATDDDSYREERRLLFVAMTRAQTSLYLTHCRARMRGAESMDRKISPFISGLITSEPKVFHIQPEALTKASRAEMSRVLGRQVVDEGLVADQVAAWLKTAPREPSPLEDALPNVQRSAWSGYSQAGSSSYRSGNSEVWNQKSHTALPPVNAGFVKAGTGTPAFSYSNRPFRPPSQHQPAPNGLSADVLTTETRYSKTGGDFRGLVVGAEKPKPPADLNRWTQVSDSSLADIKSLLPPAEPASIPTKRPSNAISSRPLKNPKS